MKIQKIAIIAAGALLCVAMAMAQGGRLFTKTFSVTAKENGTFTITATVQTDGATTPVTLSALTNTEESHL